MAQLSSTVIFGSLVVSGVVNLNNIVLIGNAVGIGLLSGTSITSTNFMLAVNGAILLASTGGHADACIHISAAYGGYNRLTQMSSATASTDALNIIASRDSGSNAQWWAWGVMANNTFVINSGTALSATTGISINTSNQLKIGTSGCILRSEHFTGFLAGGYNNLGSSEGLTSPIYCIGTNYAPSNTSFGNMYGIGFTTKGTWGGTPSGEWSLYVAAAGGIIGYIATGGSWFNGILQIGTNLRIPTSLPSALANGDIWLV
jgi:hypothetical protein